MKPPPLFSGSNRSTGPTAGPPSPSPSWPDGARRAAGLRRRRASSLGAASSVAEQGGSAKLSRSLPRRWLRVAVRKSCPINCWFSTLVAMRKDYHCHKDAPVPGCELSGKCPTVRTPRRQQPESPIPPRLERHRCLPISDTVCPAFVEVWRVLLAWFERV